MFAYIFERIQKIVDSLRKLSESKIIFLKQKSIDHLALLGSEDANNFLLVQIRTKNHKIQSHSYASKYLIRIEGDRAIDQIISTYKKYGSEDLLKSLMWLPQKTSLPLLKDLVETYDYPGESKKTGKRDDENRWRRIDAARLLAEIGQEEAIPLLVDFINSNTFFDFDRGYFVRILTTIRSPQIPTILDKIIKSKNQPLDSRIIAAEHFAPNNQHVKNFLISIISHPSIDIYDRRDAIRALTKFDLDETDIPYLLPHLNDINTNFWGVQAFTIEAMGKIGTKIAIKKLKSAYKLWSVSQHEQNKTVLQKILFEIALVEQSKTAKFLKNYFRISEVSLKRKHREFPLLWELPKMIQNYYNNYQKEALEFFTEVLNSDNPELVTGSVASAIIQEVPSIHSNKSLIESTIKLILQQKMMHPIQEFFYWEILNEIWERSDMDKSQKDLFFKD